MGFTALTAAQTDQKSPLDQVLFDLLRTNFDDHESRIKQGEDSAIRIFSHFASSALTGGIHTATANYNEYLGRFRIGISSSNFAFKEEVVATPGDHRVTWNVNDTVTTGSSLYLIGMMAFKWADVVKPAIFESRMKFAVANNFDRFELGFGSRAAGNDIINHTSGVIINGVILEKVDATNWRFNAIVGGVETNGASFAPPADAAWFTVKIEWTDTPSTQVKCYIDGTLKDTLTAGLPSAVTVYPYVRLYRSAAWASTGIKASIDSFLATLGGAIVNLT